MDGAFGSLCVLLAMERQNSKILVGYSQIPCFKSRGSPILYKCDASKPIRHLSVAVYRHLLGIFTFGFVRLLPDAGFPLAGETQGSFRANI